MADIDLDPKDLEDYHPAGMIAERLFPMVPVVSEVNGYYVWDGKGAQIAEYRAEEYASTAKNTTLSGLHRAQDAVLLDQEIRVAALATDPARYPPGHTVSLYGTRQWDEPDAHGFIALDIEAGRRVVQTATGGLLPNTIVIPRLVASGMERGGESGPLPAVIDGMRVLLAAVTHVSNKGEGGRPVVDVWGKHVLLAYVAPKPALDTITLGLIFRARSWRVDDESDGAMRVSIVEAEALIAPACGYLIRDAVA